MTISGKKIAVPILFALGTDAPTAVSIHTQDRTISAMKDNCEVFGLHLLFGLRVWPIEDDRREGSGN